MLVSKYTKHIHWNVWVMAIGYHTEFQMRKAQRVFPKNLIHLHVSLVCLWAKNRAEKLQAETWLIL